MPASLARRTMPWSNGPAKNSGKMVIRSNRTLFAWVQVPQAFWQRNINAPLGNIDAAADILGQRHQQLARSSLHLQQRRARRAFPRKKDIPHRSDHARRLFHRRCRRGEFLSRRWIFKNGAANQVADEILAVRKFHAVRNRDQHLKPAKLFGGVNRSASFEMENPVFRVIAVHPEILQTDRSRIALRATEINLQTGRKSRGKIGEKFGQNFAFIAARTNDARNLHPALLFSGGFQSSSISSVKRLCSFIPAAPRSVRMALAVRPWRPITLPRSSGCTRSSRTVTCEPSTAFTCTPSGRSTRALAISSTSSFILAPASVSNRRSSPHGPSSAERSASEFMTWT